MLHHTLLLYLLSLATGPTTHRDHGELSNVNRSESTQHRGHPSVGHLGELPNGGKKWVLLVAGSKGWANYRHQADVCHAYQILSKQGIPDERIIVMMYDDLASYESNPYPGVLINEPDGPNVYKGVPKDYTGQDVTPENFLNILQGKDMTGIGSGKTIRSGPKDHIFVYYANHGAPGMLAFPIAKQKLYADQLKKAIDQMFEQKKYANMVLYIEACYSGSMFANVLRDNINVYVTTAASPDESSYTCQYDSNILQYVNDVYSISWMLQSKHNDLTRLKLGEQYESVKINSHGYSKVMEYGDLQMRDLPTGDFQGSSGNSSKLQHINVKCDSRGPVRSTDVEAEVLKRRIEVAETDEEREKLENELNALLLHQETLETQVQAIVDTIVQSYPPGTIRPASGSIRGPINFECYRNIVSHYDDKCMDEDQDPFVFTQFEKFVSVCEQNVDEEHAADSVKKVCAYSD